MTELSSGGRNYNLQNPKYLSRPLKKQFPDTYPKPCRRHSLLVKSNCQVRNNKRIHTQLKHFMRVYKYFSVHLCTSPFKAGPRSFLWPWFRSPPHLSYINSTHNASVAISNSATARSVNKYLLCTCHVPCTVWGTGDAAVSKTDLVPAPMELSNCLSHSHLIFRKQFFLEILLHGVFPKHSI